MQITEVNVFPVNEEKLKAYVAITFDNCFVVRDLKIINGKDGLFVAMPSKKRKDGIFKDIAHPLNNDTRNLIESAVLKAYNEKIAGSGSNNNDDDEDY
ncbi:MAG: septation regulator SpoVG [Candidatus Acididesulfobacter guangdongensis]|uniref:Putative septation protein SpoVG n=1 Tax=Acididesulfobacter guangdongensis TaxID=2597225 RepID=A0A519BI19_ACIG2|nr:MAG: septation regulator SpoVG [Candidatus Acididesulfobacter guangdongensis]